MLKRIVIVVAGLVAVAVVADRFIADAAGAAAGTQIKRATHASSDADVTFNGFPFVLQAVRGKFSSVDVVAHDVPAAGLTLDRVDASFSGVHVKMAQALAGELEAVPSDKATATARLTYADLNAYLRRRGSLTVSAQAGRLLVAGQVRVKGVMISGQGKAVLTVRPGSIVLQVAEGSANGIAIPAAASRLLSLTVPTTGLPFGMSLRSVDVGEVALLLHGTATSIVIPTAKVLG